MVVTVKTNRLSSTSVNFLKTNTKKKKKEREKEGVKTDGTLTRVRVSACNQSGKQLSFPFAPPWLSSPLITARRENERETSTQLCAETCIDEAGPVRNSNDSAGQNGFAVLQPVFSTETSMENSVFTIVATRYNYVSTRFHSENSSSACSSVLA